MGRGYGRCAMDDKQGYLRRLAARPPLGCVSSGARKQERVSGGVWVGHGRSDWRRVTDGW